MDIIIDLSIRKVHFVDTQTMRNLNVNTKNLKSHAITLSHSTYIQHCSSFIYTKKKHKSINDIAFIQSY